MDELTKLSVMQKVTLKLIQELYIKRRDITVRNVLVASRGKLDNKTQVRNLMSQLINVRRIKTDGSGLYELENAIVIGNRIFPCLSKLIKEQVENNQIQYLVRETGLTKHWFYKAAKGFENVPRRVNVIEVLKAIKYPVDLYDRLESRAYSSNLIGQDC